MVGHQFSDECCDAVVDLIAGGSDGVEVLAGGVGQVPVFVALPGKIRQVSPQPMVMTTSESPMASTVSV